MFDITKNIIVESKEQTISKGTQENVSPNFANENHVSPKEQIIGSNKMYENADAPVALENLAPLDSEQAKLIAGAINEIPEFKPEVWRTLTYEQRVNALEHSEQMIAGIEKRQPPCSITVKSLGEGYYGYYANGEIVLNKTMVMDNSYQGYCNTLDTLIHEGRHAYQHYNTDVKLVHPNVPEVKAWKLNNQLGYETGECGPFDFQRLGFKHYLLQPVEVDARVFAENVLNAMNIQKEG